MKALMFPGQGSQAVGMGAGLFERFPELTRAADKVLGYSISELCLEDPENRLSRTRYAQPAIYVVNALHLAGLGEDTLGQVQFAAGHSLGEYSALLAAGAFDFANGLEMVKRRGELFDAVTEGGMAAVLGLTLAKIRHLLRTDGTESVDVANLNSQFQTVISGPTNELRRLRPVFESAGCDHYQELNVSGPFHSSHMGPAKEAFAKFLDNYSFRPLRFPVVSNVTARPYLKSRIKDFLVEQIDHPVKWRESVQYMLRNGVSELIEVGNGNVLTKIGNAIDREMSVAQ